MGKELKLRYGTNPHQVPASVVSGIKELPFKVINGSPGYINLLDALNSWQLVSELKSSLHLPAAASFKHVSPAGAAVAVPLSDDLEKAYFLSGLELSPLALAYARARGADRISSFGDWVALSDIVDKQTALLLRREVSDGVIAPGFSHEALEILTKKQGGRYCLLEIDENYKPADTESRDVFGLTMRQMRNNAIITPDGLTDIATPGEEIPAEAKRDLVVALTSLKYTQSNSICFALDGQVIGIGAGQQSRIHCTRLAASKADTWRLRQHPQTTALPFRSDLGRPERDNAVDGFLRNDLSQNELKIWAKAFLSIPEKLTAESKNDWIRSMSGVSMASDAFIPFRDNIDRAAASGVQYIAQPGGSVRDSDIIEACNEYGISVVLSGFRLFHH